MDRATTLLRTRLKRPELGPLMQGLMASLLAVLEGRRDEAVSIMENTAVYDEPEMLFYFARHCALAGAGRPMLKMVQRARVMGFSSSRTLESDPSFAALRTESGFAEELEQARRSEEVARRLYFANGGSAFGLC